MIKLRGENANYYIQKKYIANMMIFMKKLWYQMEYLY